MPVSTDNRLLDSLTDPDMVGTSEYRVVYELIDDIVASAGVAGFDVDDLELHACVIGALDELIENVKAVRNEISVCQFCHSPHTTSVLVKGLPICGTCAYIIHLTGRDPIPGEGS